MATMADGIAVGCPGEVPFAIVRELVDSIETVGEDTLSRAVLFLLERAKQLVEPAGAAAVARLLHAGKGVHDGPVVAVLSGGNIDPLLLLRIIRHGLANAGRYLQFRVRVPDTPGSLAGLLADLAGAGANVVHIEHVRMSATLPVDEVEIAVQLEAQGTTHREEILRTLREKGYAPTFD
jgi:threonine dehydratase